MFLFLANIILGLHILVVFFVVLTIPFVFIGPYFKWSLVRNFWLRIMHLVCIFVVMLQAWFGVICPLTILEIWLRKQAGVETYSGSFIEHWMQEILYWDLPSWVFVAAYSAFALLVVATWVKVPPKKLLFKRC